MPDSVKEGLAVVRRGGAPRIGPALHDGPVQGRTDALAAIPEHDEVLQLDNQPVAGLVIAILLGYDHVMDGGAVPHERDTRRP